MKKMNLLKTQKSKMNYWIGRGAVGEERVTICLVKEFFYPELKL